MNILLIAATWMEVDLLINEFEETNEKSHLFKECYWGKTNVDVLAAGIGTTFTAFHLTNALYQKKYDLVVNVGIAGSLSSELKIGDVVNVACDEFSDLGIENQHEFLTLFDAGFMEMNEYPFENGILKASYSHDFLRSLKKVRGITTNRSHGKETGIKELHGRFPAHIETMEGAAVFYVCQWMGVECCQIRSISNYVEPRDPSKWNIPLALENLKETILLLLQKITDTSD